MSIDTTPAARPRPRPISLVLLFAVAAGGVYAGVRWHTTIERWILPSARAGAGAGTDRAPTGPDSTTAAPTAKQIWTCGMHPQVMQDQPGDCPICHMKLTPLAGGNTPGGRVGAPEGAGTVVIDPAVVQNMGVRTVVASKGTLSRHVRAAATIVEPESARSDVSLRVSGWIEKLHADTEGMKVRAGEPLFDLYSPELRQAIEELIAARRAASSAPSDSTSSGVAVPSASTVLVEAAQARLRALGLTPEQVEQLGGLDHAPATVTFTSPIDAIVVEKAEIYSGSGVMAGQTVLRLADRSTMWVEARVPEHSLRHVKLGQRASVRVGALGSEPIAGEVMFIHPDLDDMTRTALVRATIPNPDGLLRVGMYAIAEFDASTAESVTILPREAVIDTGESQVVFISAGKGRFEPRRVVLGEPGDGGVVGVASGVEPGEVVVASGQFLIDSESRLREAIAKFLGQGALEASSPAAPPVAPGVAPGVAPVVADATPEQQKLVDAVITEYLRLSNILGAEQKERETAPKLELQPLISAAHAFHASLAGTKHERLTLGVIKASEAMTGHPLEHQRQLFSALGERLVELIDVYPPSRAAIAADAGQGGVAELYLMNCPMAPGGAKGDWLQTSPDVANPFFAADMKSCGGPVRTIKTREPVR
ncbi:MAG: efflux RND transporter periplasmic adaptor subunit [Phycisphaerales bacterium]|jgi:Cu(I)/Ag(I) efflux system membrane fusion protein|nr:efflux RND transporter periplasmic adaptor subunit [Phycisphaerales bacterium]